MPRGESTRSQMKKCYDRIVKRIGAYRKDLYRRPEHWDRLQSLYPETMIFLNYGAAPTRGEVRLSWLKPKHRDYRYYVHLLTRVLDRTSLKGKDILDVGCGRGGHAWIMAEYLGAHRVVGVDFSKESVKFAKKHHRVPSLSFVKADAHDLPFADASFDVVLNIASSSMYRDRGTFYREVWRVLRPGGVFCYSDAVQVGKEKAYVRALTRQGFEIAKQTDMTNELVAGIRKNAPIIKKLIFRPGLCREPIESAMSMMYGANVVGQGKLLSGKIRFYSWKIRKPAR